MEILDYSNYYTEKVTKSKLIKGLMVTDYDNGTLVCPRCLEPHKNIEHGGKTRCKCGLNMERRGNILQIS